MLKNWLVMIVKVTWLLSLRDSVMRWGVGGMDSHMQTLGLLVVSHHQSENLDIFGLS